MRLHAHGEGAGGAVRGIDVHAEIGGDGLLHLSWRLDAELSKLRVPAPAIPSRADGLWRHTCFEAFIARRGYVRILRAEFFALR